MGSYHNKQEEVIIAQNGANNASQSAWEQKIETYGIVIAGLLAIILLISIILICKKWNKGVKKWAKNQIVAVVASSQMDKVPQQPASVQYA